MYENKVGGKQISPVQTVRPVSCRLKTLLQMSKVDHTITHSSQIRNKSATVSAPLTQAANAKEMLISKCGALWLLPVSAALTKDITCGLSASALYQVDTSLYTQT